MNQIKKVALIATFLITLSFIIPSLLVLPFSNDKAELALNEHEAVDTVASNERKQTGANKVTTEVAVFRSKLNKVEKLPLEEYVVGVVASEMPANFEVEALKAQALTARTYIVNHLLHATEQSLPEGAHVKDTVEHQVYKSKKDLKKLWGKDYEWKLKKVTDAVKATEGEILTYKNKPITASFFSTSNGYTENAEEYWKNKIPYLRSVESPWDNESEEFSAQSVMSTKEFEKRLNVNIKDTNDIGTITARTSGKKVAKVVIGGKEFTGREIREKLGLRSTDFSWEKRGDSIIIVTKGYGHGVGMSQYGANGMAKEGKKYADIVNHYYQGVSIAQAEHFVDQKVAYNE